jgi:hypothetical protein
VLSLRAVAIGYTVAALGYRRAMDATHEDYGTVSGEHEYKAALRVFSETVRLSELRSMLGEPTHSHDLGDPVGRVGAVRRHAHWGSRARLSGRGRSMST